MAMIQRAIYVVCLLLPLNCLAVQTGFYAGIGAGDSEMNLTTKEVSAFFSTASGPIDFTAISGSIDSSDIGGRIFVGYNVNQFLGVEAAYKQFSTSENNITATGPDNCNTIVEICRIDLDLTPRIFEALAKLTIGINPIDIFVKAGFARVQLKGAATLNKSANTSCTPNTTNTDICIKETVTEKEFSAVIGAGIAYDFNANVSFDITFERFRKSGNIPDLDYIGFNVTYFFEGVDTCGELLC